MYSNAVQTARTRAAAQQGIKLGKRAPTEAEIDRTAEQFEAMFLTEMLQQVWKGEETESFTGGGFAGDTYHQMLVDEYAKVLTRTGGVGVAAQVKREILKLQEVP